MRAIAWICVDFNAGSGGHRTIFQNFNYLVESGYECDLYVIDSNSSAEAIEKKIKKDYFELNGGVYVGKELKRKYDMVIATYYGTVECVRRMNVKKKAYFIQDYEPWFFPMSDNYLVARESYKCGLDGISIGGWLSNKLQYDFGARMRHFSFCADLKAYFRDEKIKEENAVCFVFQPDKPRRCYKMGLKALQIVQEKKPDLKIYLFGSPKAKIYNMGAEHLGLLSVEECNLLYNKCKVGICMSSSNPSRIPFEMMAAGLPVVDLYLENNLYDFPEDGCLLAKPSAEAIATAILKLLDEKRMRERLSGGGTKFMQKYPLEREFQEFKAAVDGYFEEGLDDDEVVKKKYLRRPIEGSNDLVCGDKEVYFKTTEELKREENEKERLRQEEEWRKNLTVLQKIYLKIRYILLGK